MRTTLDIEDDVFLAARERAVRDKISIGKAVSILARAGLTGPATVHGKSGAKPRGRLAMLAKRNEIVTLEHVRSIADDEGV